MAKKRTTSTRKKTTTRKKRTGATRGGTSSKSSSSRSKRSSSRRKTTRRTPKQQAQQRALIAGMGILLLTAIIILSLLSPNQGGLTIALAGLMGRLFGLGKFVIPLIGGAVGAALFWWGTDKPLKLPTLRLVGFGLLFTLVETSLSLGMVMRNNLFFDVWTVAQAGQGGGYFGGLFAYVLMELVGIPGTIIILSVVGLISVYWMSGMTREELGYWISVAKDWIVDTWQALRAQPEPAPQRAITYNKRGRQQMLDEPPHQPPLPDPETVTPAASTNEPEPAPVQPRRASRRTPAPVEAEPTVVSPVFLGQNGRSRSNETWVLPKLEEMLEPGRDTDDTNSFIREQVEVIEHTLESFGAPATVVEINQGPTITQFGVEPSFIEMRSGKRTKVKVSKIAGLADDLALALAAEAIRIQAPVPGKGFIGIEVPNSAKAVVSLRDVMETAAFQKIKSPLRIGLGQDVAGQPIVADLAAMPHLLIAGTTGSGKSVCVNGIIACLLLQNTPDTLKLVMVDPKRVELTGYNGIPHLAAPVIVEIDKVIGTLQWALREMDNRYKMFAEVGARNITDFNKRVDKVSKYDPLPYIVIIIDELADLMMLSPEDTERSVTRLAQLARATGMHMVIATQRPSVDVVTGLIKANFPARVAFAVASGTDSRVILDSTGAERLLGQGDMLFQAPDAPAPVRSQGCFVSTTELNKLTNYWKTARRTNFVRAEESVQRRETAVPPAAPPPTPPTRAATPSPSPAPSEETKPQPKVDAPVVNLPLDGVDEVPDDAPTVPHEPIERPVAPAQPKPIAIGDHTAKPELVQEPLWEALQAEEEEPEMEKPDDDLLEEAIALVREIDKASTSLLQRRFRIGYTRAARLIDYMEVAGIIGPPTGTSKAREVLSADGDAEDGTAEDGA